MNCADLPAIATNAELAEVVDELHASGWDVVLAVVGGGMHRLPPVPVDLVRARVPLVDEAAVTPPIAGRCTIVVEESAGGWQLEPVSAPPPPPGAPPPPERRPGRFPTELLGAAVGAGAAFAAWPCERPGPTASPLAFGELDAGHGIVSLAIGLDLLPMLAWPTGSCDAEVGRALTVTAGPWFGVGDVRIGPFGSFAEFPEAGLRSSVTPWSRPHHVARSGIESRVGWIPADGGVMFSVAYTVAWRPG